VGRVQGDRHGVHVLRREIVFADALWEVESLQRG